MDFGFLKSEMGKVGTVDWETVEKKCLTLTREKSKDLRVLSYLSFVYLRQEKWEAWVDIFEGMAQLASTQNWDVIYPDRPTAKQLVFKWLAEARYVDTLNEKKPAEAEYPHMERLLKALTALKGVVDPKFPEGSPFPSQLFGFAQKWEKALKPKPKVEAAPATAAAGAAPAAGGSTQQLSDPMDTPKQAQVIGKKVALFLIDKEPQKAMGYRLSRTLRWDLMEKAPPVANGQTQLPGPAAEQRTYFQSLVAKADWQTALPAAEKAFTAGANHLWLDLQRVAVKACASLGTPFASVKDAILFETALLLKRIPELTSLSFTDGSAFCDDATKDWISAEVLPVLQSGGAAQPAGGGQSGGDPIEAEKKEVNALVAAGKIDAAIALLQAGLRQGGTERDSFRRSLLLGQILLSAKRPDIAMSVLDSLDEKIDAYRLERWDPDLAVEVWTVMVKACRAILPSKPQNLQAAIHEKQNTILTKLSRTNPMSAFNINP
jgi:type VI secretion system protein VasJ